MNVKEMYVSNGNVTNSHFILRIMDNGSANLDWYMGDTIVSQVETCIKKRYDGSMDVEFGDQNLFGIKQSIPFVSENGKLDERWEKIK